MATSLARAPPTILRTPSSLIASRLAPALRARVTPASPRFFSAARVAPVAMASPSPAVEMWVKGDPKTETLLDCPFCHRALLTAAAKSVPVKRGYIDFAAKPDWLLQVNPQGSVPVMKDLATESWVVDSGVICDWLEDKYPQPAMGHVADAPSAGGDVFPAFTAFLRTPASDGAASAEKGAALTAALVKLAQYFEEGHAFLGPGDGFGSGDAALAPKLHHMLVALPHFKAAAGGWALPPGAEAVGSYMERVRALPAWKACAYSDDAVIAGWNRHLAQKH